MRLKNTAIARSSSSPERSSATMVFSKLGAASRPVMARTSRSCAAMPSAKASR